MAQGVKEGLVDSPLDWPGASAVPALLGDMTLRGRWVSRDELRAARRSRGGIETPEAAFTSHPEVRLTPLPCWAGLTPDELRQKHRELVSTIVEDRRITRGNRPSLGVPAILAQEPLASPTESARSPAPICHASTPALRQRFVNAYRAFVAAFREAAHNASVALKITTTFHAPERVLAGFPPGCFPRPGWHVPASRDVMRDVVIDLTGPPGVALAT
jgi:hypothetical protein